MYTYVFIIIYIYICLSTPLHIYLSDIVSLYSLYVNSKYVYKCMYVYFKNRSCRFTYVTISISLYPSQYLSRCVFLLSIVLLFSSYSQVLTLRKIQYKFCYIIFSLFISIAWKKNWTCEKFIRLFFSIYNIIFGLYSINLRMYLLCN